MQVEPVQSGARSESLDRCSGKDLVKAISCANLPATLVDKKGAAAALSVSPSTLKNYRKQHWLEGLHFCRLGPRVVRYNLELIVDWAINRSDPQAHQRAIEAFLFKLESNQSAGKRRRKSK